MKELEDSKLLNMRQFLMKAIIPVLTEGMIDVYRVAPTDPVLFAFLVELGYCWQIIVGATIAFDVDAHVFEHLKSVTVCFELKHFSLMLLKETRHWELAWLCLWVAEVSSVVCSFKQRYVVFVIEVFKTAGHVFSVPLEVALCV